MINYWITDSKTFNYHTDVTTNLYLRVYEDDVLIYSVNSEIIAGVNYYTTMMSGWNTKKVFLLDKNTNEEITFDLIGKQDVLTDDEKIKFDKYVTTLTLTERTELCDIMERNGSDKSTLHNYTRYYSQIFDKYKHYEINIFELGLGTNNPNFEFNMGSNGVPGASILGWSEYFTKSNVFGADIDTGCLFNTNRIKTFYCDQTNPYIVRQMWDSKYLDFKLDIIIEDGLHTFNGNVTFFENSYHKLSYNGIFIIEDIDSGELINWVNKIEEYETVLPQFKFEVIRLVYTNKPDNNLIKITYR